MPLPKITTARSKNLQVNTVNRYPPLNTVLLRLSLIVTVTDARGITGIPIFRDGRYCCRYRRRVKIVHVSKKNKNVHLFRIYSLLHISHGSRSPGWFIVRNRCTCCVQYTYEITNAFVLCKIRDALPRTMKRIFPPGKKYHSQGFVGGGVGRRIGLLFLCVGTPTVKNTSVREQNAGRRAWFAIVVGFDRELVLNIFEKNKTNGLNKNTWKLFIPARTQAV